MKRWFGLPVAAVALTVAFVVAESRHPAPLVDLALLRRPVFAAANLAAATVMFVLLATSVYLSDFLQAFQGSTPFEAGLTPAAFAARRLRV